MKASERAAAKIVDGLNSVTRHTKFTHECDAGMAEIIDRQFERLVKAAGHLEMLAAFAPISNNAVPPALEELRVALREVKGQ